MERLANGKIKYRVHGYANGWTTCILTKSQIQTLRIEYHNKGKDINGIDSFQNYVEAVLAYNN